MRFTEPMRTWGQEGPREKLNQIGARNLSDVELLAIILRSGIPSQNVMSTARLLLEKSHGCLATLKTWKQEEFLQIQGIGKVKAGILTSIFELAQRIASARYQDEKITSSDQAFPLFYGKMANNTVEEFWVLFLRRNNSIIALEQISKGGTSGTVVDPKTVFKRGLLLNASGMILAHNHPSANLKPSEQDIALTKRMVQLGKLMDLSVLDHIIVCGTRYYSFMDEGRM